MIKYRKYRGAATLELAILVPVLALTLFFGVEVGRAIQARTLLINGLHHSLLVALRTLYADKSLWGRNNNDEYVIEDTVLDKMISDLDGYVGKHVLQSAARDYVCQCTPPPGDEETTATIGKVPCDDVDIAACPNESTQVYLTLTSGLNFIHALGGIIPVGPLDAVIRIK